MKNKKVLIIGLDSGSWEIFNPVLERGKMLCLKELRDKGFHGILRSTYPPLTPPAWTSLMTGVYPGAHGVTDWQAYDVNTNRLYFTTSKSIAVETMWSYLSRCGYKVASINLPQTYPPYPVNGVMISGYGSPGIESDCSYPPEFKKEILKHIPDYDFILRDWQKDDMSDDEVFTRVMDSSKRSYKNSYKVAELVTQRYGWDVMLVQIQQFDAILHKIWHYITPAAWAQRPDRARQIFDMLDCLDGTIGRLARLADGADDLVVLVSDHGHGPNYGNIKPNVLLQQWGYLQPQQKSRHLGLRLKRNVMKMLGKKMGHHQGSMNLIDRLKLDWSATQAVTAHATQQGFVFLNVKGRQKAGTVEPGPPYQRLVKKLQQRFLQIRDPRNNNPVFDQVTTPQQLYGVSDERAGHFGDLLLVPAQGYWVIRSMQGPDFIDYFDKNHPEGSHCREGMYILKGGNIKTGGCLDADIVDILPTIYAALGIALPDYLEGRVLTECFQTPPAPAPADQMTQPKPEPSKTPEVPDLSEAEEIEIGKRLADLGYLE